MKPERVNVRLSVVAEMTQWINENVQRGIHAADVTKQSGYTHWHFQRLFREVTGYTLSEYIRLSRILSIACVLATSNLKITHICYDYGFPGQQGVARLFRKYLNCTPTDFRRCGQENPDLLSMITDTLLAEYTYVKKASRKDEKKLHLNDAAQTNSNM